MTEAKQEADKHIEDAELMSASSELQDDTGGHIQPKRFNLWQTLGMNFSITATPLAVGAYLALIIGLGGSPFYIWGFLLASVFQLITCVALAEIASAMPHTSGPAFWVQQLSPPKASQFLGYLVGWTTNAFWWFSVVANCLYMSQLTLGLASALSGYAPQQWHYYLLYIAYSVLLFMINLPRFFKAVPHVLFSGVVVINAVSIFIVISLLVRARPKPSAHQVFAVVENGTGWPNGVVFFLSLTPGIISVFAFDATTHITNEVENPSKQVPQVMIGSATLSTIAGFAMTIIYSFCMVNQANLLTSFANQPLLQLMYDGHRSNVLTAIGCVGVIIGFLISSVGCFTSWNRLYWSFACGGGLPFPRTMSKLSSRDKLPLNALAVNLALVIALGAVQLGSLTALNGIIGGAVICMTTTYSLTFGLALWRGRGFLSAHKTRWLDLGRLGTPLQAISMVWCMFITVWLCFPLYLPVAVPYMNWASVVVAGILVCSLSYWLAFRKLVGNM